MAIKFSKISYFSKQQHRSADTRILIPCSLMCGGNLNPFLATDVLKGLLLNMSGSVRV